MPRLWLLPPAGRPVGVVLMVLGLGCGAAYYLGHRPELFDLPVFAAVSAYAGTRFFVIARTNALDELFAVCCVGGAALVALSRERIELEGYDALRMHAFVRAAWITLGTWVVGFLLVFGWPIAVVVVTAWPVFLLTYYACFRVLVARP